MMEMILEGKIVDVVARSIRKGKLYVSQGRIERIEYKDVDSEHYILPGLIDAHVHIESSMLVPSGFARLACVHGTTATVSDPHEIANVLGLEGVEFMIRNGAKVPFGFYFGAPSCVPATPFESSGAELGPDEIEALLARDDVYYLSEMMNFPGVLNKDDAVMAKLAIARKYGKKVDGHAPGVLGNDAKAYAASGITSDHECFTIEEARDKIAAGMKVQIREGSAAKNFDTLIPLLREFPDEVMFCSDDKHPDDLMQGHINQLVRRSVQKGYSFMDALRACTYIPVKHYGLKSGLLQPGDPADMIIIDDPSKFNVQASYYQGTLIAKSGHSLIPHIESDAPNRFEAEAITAIDIEVADEGRDIKVIQALEGQLITRASFARPTLRDGKVVSNTEKDILKMVVLNRYELSRPAVSFVQNFGLKKGAIASSVAHDSHNIIATGATDEEIVGAVNAIIGAKGGVAVCEGQKTEVLALPVGGIMSNEVAGEVAQKYETLDQAAKNLGSELNAPFMTLSFMALLVIPELKLSDKGLFDGKNFVFTDIFY